MLKCKFLSSIYRPSTTSRQLTSDFWPIQTKFVLLPTLNCLILICLLIWPKVLHSWVLSEESSVNPYFIEKWVSRLHALISRIQLTLTPSVNKCSA